MNLKVNKKYCKGYSVMSTLAPPEVRVEIIAFVISLIAISSTLPIAITPI